MTEPNPHPDTSETPARRGLRGLVDRLVKVLARSSPGDVATLRRLDPADPSCPAFWKITLGHIDSPAYPLSPLQEQRWAVVLSGLARSGELHRPGRRAGEAMAAVISEARFVRLLRANGERLWDELRHVTHQLSSKGEPFDWGDLAELVLTDGGEKAESVRRSLARDFYGALARAESDSKKIQET